MKRLGGYEGPLSVSQKQLLVTSNYAARELFLKSTTRRFRDQDHTRVT